MTATDAPVAAAPPQPRWTVPSFRRTPGRYPLGVEAVNFNQLADLASGLPVLSQHPRYWSIYTYIVKSFWDRGLTPQTTVRLGRFLKPHEVVFASAALLCDRHPELPGIIGRDTIAPHLREARDDLRLDLDYLGQNLGGYGQVYRGAMADLGLILRAELTPGARVDAPMGDLGASIANAFGRAIAGTTYARQHAGQTEGTIPLGVVRELAQASCFCRLGEVGTERDLLVDLLLGRLQPPHEAHRNRAATVRLFLDLAQATDGLAIDEERFRRLLYWGADEEGGTWRPSSSVEPAWRRWWLARHRELMVGALNALFVHFVRWGLDSGGALRPQPIAEYAAAISALRPSVDLGIGSATLVETTLSAVVATLDSFVRADGWPMKAGTDSPREDRILDRARRGIAADAPVYALVALLIALRRVNVFLEATAASPAEKAMLDDGGIDRIGTSVLVEWVDRHLAAADSLADVLVDLLRTFVVRQHLRIARGKLPEDTFRFHEDGGALRFVDQGDHQGINPISIRFNAVASALSELQMVAAPFGQPGHRPTPLGAEVLGV